MGKDRIKFEVFPDRLHLRRADIAKNMRRFYLMTVHRDLFGGATWVREWGRIGSSGTSATTHAKIGTPIHVTEKLLNHVSGTIIGVAAVYNRHSYMEEMRAAVSEYDVYLKSTLSPR
jgi:hypothetical protein